MGVAVQTNKSDRISIRLEPVVKQKIEEAAAVDHRSLTSFIIASAAEMAEKILKRNEQMTLNENDWDTFFNALINPPKPNKALKDAFRNYSNLHIKSDI